MEEPKNTIPPTEGQNPEGEKTPTEGQNPEGEKTPAPAAATLTPELVQQMIDASLGAFSDAMQILKAAADDGDKIPDEEGDEGDDPDKEKSKEPEQDKEVKNDW